MMFPKPPKKEKKAKKPLRTRPAADKKASFIDYASMTYAKPVIVKKQPKAINVRRKSTDSKKTINKRFCFFCGSTDNLERHHIFFGNGERELSEFYGLAVWLDYEDHRGNNGVHFNREKDLELKRFGQIWFNEHYPELDFLSIFGRNYL